MVLIKNITFLENRVNREKRFCFQKNMFIDL